MEEIKEEWKSLDFIGYPEYEVSTFGNVKSLARKGTYDRILKPFPRGKYYSVDLFKDGKRKSFLVHRLVAMAFIPNSYNLPQVNHKDEDTSHNHVDNLEWCNNLYNCNYGKHKERLSEKLKGKNKGKISPRRKPIIQYTLSGEFIKEFDSATTASKELNLNQASICNCCNGKYKQSGGFVWRYKN